MGIIRLLFFTIRQLNIVIGFQCIVKVDLENGSIERITLTVLVNYHLSFRKL